MKVIMGGFVASEIGKRQYFPQIINPGPKDIDDFLLQVASRHGCISVELEDVPEEADADLTLFSQQGEFLLVLNEKWDTGVVRTFENQTAPNEFVEVHGNVFHARDLFRDIAIARAALLEFCQRGDVSRTLLK
ncbi:DUF6911 family protein [Roseateles sp. MS654]|uniref:DUF6911 family protein n=1 Tax=Roseateles sp. MS654 TaxID=3412685 RepID=UPI003C30C79B